MSIWTAVLPRREGIWTSQYSNVQMPVGLPGGMLKLQFDWYIMEGHFSVRLADESPFGRTLVNQTSISTARRLLQICYTTYFTPVRFENKNSSNSTRKGFKAPLPRRRYTSLWSWKNWRRLRHSIRRKQSRLREEPWYSRLTDLFSGEW